MSTAQENRDHYEDVPAPDGGATGPENVVKRLLIGLEPIERLAKFSEADFS